MIKKKLHGPSTSLESIYRMRREAPPSKQSILSCFAVTILHLTLMLVRIETIKTAINKGKCCNCGSMRSQKISINTCCVLAKNRITEVKSVLLENVMRSYFCIYSLINGSLPHC